MIPTFRDSIEAILILIVMPFVAVTSPDWARATSRRIHRRIVRYREFHRLMEGSLGGGRDEALVVRRVPEPSRGWL